MNGIYHARLVHTYSNANASMVHTMFKTIESFHSTNFEGSKSMKNNLNEKMGLQCINDDMRMCGKGK